MSSTPQRSPQRGPIAWADLLRTTAQLPRERWADAALAFGLEWTPAALAPAPAATEPETGDPFAHLKPATPAAAAAPAPATTPVYWRVAAHRVDPQPPPDQTDWLNQPLAQPAAPGETLFESAGSAQLLPEPVISRARIATLLRRHLVSQRRSAELDWAWLIPRLARLQMPARWRVRQVASWPRSVNVVWQDTQALRAVRADLSSAVSDACQLLGNRARLVRAGGAPDSAVFDDNNQAVDASRHSADAWVMFGLGDRVNAPGQQHWAAWAHSCASSGQRQPLLIAAAPPRLLAAATADAFRLVVCDDETGAHAMSPGSSPGPSPSPRPDTNTDPDPDPDEATAAQPVAQAHPALPANPGLRLLCAALAGSHYVPLATLRALRRNLVDAGCALDLGHEIELLADTARVLADTGACALHPSLQAPALQALRQLAPDLRRIVLRTMWHGHRQLSPPVRAVYALSLMNLGLPAQELAPLRADGLFDAALALPATMARALHREGTAALPSGLAGYVRGLAEIRPDLMAADQDLGTAWVVAARNALTAGLIDPPPWLQPAHLRGLGPVAGNLGPSLLRVVGSKLDLIPAHTTHAGPNLALVPYSPFWQVEPLPPPPEATRAAAFQQLPLRERKQLLREQCLDAGMQPVAAKPRRASGKSGGDYEDHDRFSNPAWLIDHLSSQADTLATEPERFEQEFNAGLRQLALQQKLNLRLMLSGLDLALGLPLASEDRKSTRLNSSHRH